MRIHGPRRSLLYSVVLAILVAAPGLAQVPSPSPQPLGGSTPFLRGDSNGDGAVDLADAIRILEFLFPPGPLPVPFECDDAADANDSEAIDIADGIYVLNYLFILGPAPPPPFPDCGADPTNDLALGCQSFEFCVVPTDRATAAHILRRIAYGGRPEEIETVIQVGAEAYILEQLDPLSIEESPSLISRLALLDPSASYVDYYRMVLLRGIYSTRQLQEQLVDFWSNHFNTYFWTVRAHLRDLPSGVYTSATSREAAMVLEEREDDLFRQHALGFFEDLVIDNATSPTMLIYLDNVSNLAADPNENYARELLELHTVGVDGGYTQGDVEELARCFTGWTICKKAPANVGDPAAPCLPDNDPTGEWSFHFDAPNHDYGAKSLFPGTSYPLSIPARPNGSPDGVLDGFEVIAHLSTVPQTATFVCTKLARKFLADDPPGSVVAAMVAEWIATGGDIRAVMEVLLLSEEFLGTTYRWNKVKTPMETLNSTVRTLEGLTTNAGPVLSTVALLRHVPLNWNTPDGYPERGSDWIGTSKLVDTIKFNQLVYDTTTTLTYNPYGIQVAAATDGTDPNAVVDFWLELMFPGATTTVDRDLALLFYTTLDDGVTPTNFGTGSLAYQEQLRKFVAFLRSWPQAMKQ